MKKLKAILILLLFLTGGAVVSQAQTARITSILEQFCVGLYDDCYDPCQYIPNSLRVTSTEVDETNGKIYVKGKHSYYGQYIPLYGRKKHTDVDFKAEIIPANVGVKVKFWKWCESDWTQSAHWQEACEKTILL